MTTPKYEEWLLDESRERTEPETGRKFRIVNYDGALAHLKNSRLEVLRECLEYILDPVFGLPQELIAPYAKGLLHKWLSRGDLTQEEYEWLLEEFHLN